MRTDQMVRIIVHDHADAYVCEMDPAQVASATIIEAVNGEHSLTITTAQELGKGDRLTVRDAMGRWHEYVVLGIESRHAEGGLVLHEHYCVWSLQYDLSGTYINNQYGCGVVPGKPSVPQTARKALECALGGTSRWTIGTVSVTTMSSASFYRRSGWDGLKTVLERWGGELQATITVSATGVVTRAVDLLQHVGKSTATRRFDYGADLTGIRRTFADDVWPCRIVPLGKSVETDAGGYTRRPSIESVNGGVAWLQDDAMVPSVRVPNGSGGWEYPTVIVKNDTYEDPADLKAWATAHIRDYTTPTVSYEANVAQFAEAGLDPHGVALGDEVAIVDRTFGEGGLRLAARVTKIKRDLMDPARAELTIGNADVSLAAQLGDITREVQELASQVASGSEFQSSSAYMDAIIERLNTEINATGGYWYIVPGYGTRTYDVPVSDPAVGAEASQVVEVRGGTIRIANSRDSSGNWEWRTVIQSGLIAADVLNADNIRAGRIASFDDKSFWDLDTGMFERGLTLEPLIDVASVTLQYSGSGQAVGGMVNALAHRDYVVAISSTLEDVGLLVAHLTTTQNFHLSNMETRFENAGTTEDGLYRHTALIRTYTRSGSMQLRFSINNEMSLEGAVLSNVRLYLVPDTGSGVMQFSLRSADGLDTLAATMTGSDIRLSDGTIQSILNPRKLALNYDTKTKFGAGLTIGEAPNNSTYYPNYGWHFIVLDDKRLQIGYEGLIEGQKRDHHMTLEYVLDEDNLYQMCMRLSSIHYMILSSKRLDTDDIAKAIETEISSDSSTVSSTSLASLSGTHVARRAGRTVSVYITELTLLEALSNNTYSGTLCTVPEGYRPPTSVYTLAVHAGSPGFGGSYFRIGTNGAVTLRNESGAAIPRSSVFAMTVTYVMA